MTLDVFDLRDAVIADEAQDVRLSQGTHRCEPVRLIEGRRSRARCRRSLVRVASLSDPVSATTVRGGR